MCKKWKIGWGITSECNMNCPFCYSKNARVDSSDIDINTAIKFIDHNWQNIESINYGTGENTLSKTWIDTLKYIGDNYNSISQALTTNGYLSHLIKEGKHKEVMNYLAEVDVSFDIADKKKYNLFRGNPNTYQWVIDTLEICNERSIPTTLVTIGLNETLQMDNIEKIIEIAAKCDCFFRMNIFRPNADQKLAPVDYTLLKRTVKWLVNNTNVVSLGDPLFSALIMNDRKADNSGSTSLRILPDGSITPSTYLVSNEWKCGNIKDNVKLSDESIFNKILDVIDFDNNIPNECYNCALRDKCKGGALDRRIIWYGHLKERDPYCPYRHNDSIEDWTINSKINSVSGPKIHDGYLPTLIFKP